MSELRAIRIVIFLTQSIMQVIIFYLLNSIQVSDKQGMYPILGMIS